MPMFSCRFALSPFAAGATSFRIASMEQSFALGAGRAVAHTDAASRKQVAAWLLICCALVFAMVVVGGVTRLTHSGLSIVEWQPLVGTLPPLSAADWDAAFAKYQATPEYRL